MRRNQPVKLRIVQTNSRFGLPVNSRLPYLTRSKVWCVQQATNLGVNIGLSTLFCLLIGLSGCERGTQRYDVNGTVTYRGKLIDIGEIVFSPADGKGRPDGGRITDGRYSVKLTSGLKSVSISAESNDPELVKNLPPLHSSYPADTPRSYLPKKYNEKSTLTAEVAPRSGQRLDFDLTE